MGVAQLVKIVGDARVKAPASSTAVRTCIGCKQTDAREQLVRLVRSTNASGEPEVLVDVKRRLPGRGAWLHPRPDCLKLAVKRRAIGRALPGATNVADVETQLARQPETAPESL